MDISLLHAFEQALVTLHETLEQSKQKYSALFSSMVKGQDISEELTQDIFSSHIGDARKKLHVIQTTVSNILDPSSGTLSLSEIVQQIGNQCDIDVNALALGCIRLYDEIRYLTQGIEKYYANKVEEYRNFFDTVYEEKQKKQGYNLEDTKSSIADNSSLPSSANVHGGSNTGLLVSKNA